MLTYPVILTPDDNKTVMVTSRDFPELVSFGEDDQNALLHAVDAFEEAIAARIAKREDVPAPSRGKTRVALPTQTTIKTIIYQAMRDADLTKADMARKLAWHGPQVDRLLDIHHASRLDQLDQAAAALGKNLRVDVVSVE